MKQGMRVGRRASMPRAGSCTFYFTDLPADGPGYVPSGCGTFTPAPDVFYPLHLPQGGSTVAEWLACWTQAQKGPGSNRSRDAVR